MISEGVDGSHQDGQHPQPVSKHDVSEQAITYHTHLAASDRHRGMDVHGDAVMVYYLIHQIYCRLFMFMYDHWDAHILRSQ